MITWLLCICNQNLYDCCLAKRDAACPVQDFRNKSDALSHHRDMVDKVNACADLNCYFTCSRDGCVR